MKANSLLRMICFILLTTSFFISAQEIDMSLLLGLNARSIGPAGMSGRVTSIDVVRNNPEIIYIGTASGGLWKSVNAGISWNPIFDKEGAASIGAVAINQQVPDIIWVGTGEGNPRNSQTSGKGIYKSLDGGKTWKHLGLEKTRNIHKVLINPLNSDVVYVAAQGSAWGESSERGIYKTTDGGETWEKLLFVNQRTGAADLIMDPKNPDKLFAAMWEFKRDPWFFKSGGEGSGLYATVDGGKTWNKRTDKDGLPKGELGRIGLAIAPSSPNVVYALIESKKTALYKSVDGGYKWEKTSNKNIGNRPFYYAEIYIDTKNENRIYNLYSVVDVSEDGGKNFTNLIPWSDIHPDHHAWYIHPDDPNYLIDGNDGGLAISRDRGKTWRFIENLPLAQFYHINYDMEKPYNVYGGMQDNGSWKGPSRVLKHGGIRNNYWQEVGFGDGFDVVPDKSNSRYGYAMSQGGWLYRYDSETGYSKTIRPTHPEGKELRFNWNAGIAHDEFDDHTIYYGSQFLHKSTNRGDTWEIISPDLTTNDPAKQKQMESGGLSYDVTDAENYTTIISIAQSPLNKDIIWVGTDDGNLQLTKDGGRTWKNTSNKMNCPSGSWIPQIKASKYNEAKAFAAVNNYRRDDWTPYLFHTHDYGKSWENLAANTKMDGYVLSFIQDPIESNLMFLGTEFGLYISFNAGSEWTKWTQGFPTVSTMDLQIHPRENDLIIGTFGRAAYIIDNISVLRTAAISGKDFWNEKLKLFSIPDAEKSIYIQPAGIRFAGESIFKGENLNSGAMISYYLNSKKIKEKFEEAKDSAGIKSLTDSLKIFIYNSNNELIRTITKTPKDGLNRIYWNLDAKGIRFPNSPKPKPDSEERGGSPILPGSYKVKISYGKVEDSTNVNVLFDSRFDFKLSDLEKRISMFNSRLKEKIEITTEAADRLRDIKKTIEIITDQLKDDTSFANLKDLGKSLTDSLKTLDELINQKEVQGIRYDDTLLGARLSSAYRTLVYGDDQPSQAEEVALMLAEKSFNEAIPRLNSFFEINWKQYQKQIVENKISFFKNYESLLKN